MTLAASGPLSELVWSPDKGLSLKCADSSFTDRKTSLFWDVGPSNMVLDPPQSVIGVMSTTNKPTDDVFVKPIAAVCIKSDIADTDTPTQHLTSDSGVMPECKKYAEHKTGSGGKMEEMSTAERNICDQINTGTAQISEEKGDKVSIISGKADKMQFDNLLLQADEPKPSMEQNPLPRDHTSGGGDIGNANQVFKADDVLSAKVCPVIEYKDSGAPGTKLTSASRSPFEKLESTAENDLQTFNFEAACGAASGVLVSKSNEIENKSQNDEMMLLGDQNHPVVYSPSNTRIHMYSNKGKEKALSDGDIDVKFSKEEDESHESVESCNSAGLFLTAKKRLNFQQQLMVGSKRVKKQIQETSVSKSFVKQDSSFMNWISNMMKGFSQSIQDATNCLAQTLPYPDQGHQWPDQKLITYTRNQDETKITGFQSIFQSIYSPSMKNVGTRMSSANHQVGKDSKNSDLDNRVHGIDATPITCCAENDSLYKQYLHANEFEGSRWRHQAGPLSQLKIEPINFVNSDESSKINSVENKNCSNLGLSKEKEGMTSNSSSDRQNMSNTQNIDSYALAERKETDNICHRSDSMGSLWITRFVPISTAPLKGSDHLNWSGGTQVHSTDCSRLPHSQKHIAHLNKCKIEETTEKSADDRFLIEAKELQNCSINSEVSGNNDHQSVQKFNPMLPSLRLKNSDPMASKFARRLDAIKCIIPSNRTDNTRQENMTCLFCGIRGHQLCDCSEIAGYELQDLLKKKISYVGLEELPCLCIKCFQLGHWAISCPTSVSRGQHELEVNVLVNDCSPSGRQFNGGNGDSPMLPTVKEDQVISGCDINDEIDPQAKRNINLIWKSNEIITYEKIGSNASMKKYFGSNSEKNIVKENNMASPCILVERQISEVPKKIFDAVKTLRLSRIDILKWINAHMSISHLDGFFLRLRLGKCKEGLGGTRYYVASINEVHRQSSQQNTGKSVFVNVGGIKCLVESRYISNHDFLEDLH